MINESESQTTDCENSQYITNKSLVLIMYQELLQTDKKMWEGVQY